VPELTTEGEPLWLVQWLVDPGSHVLAGDGLAEVLVPGTLVQVAAPVSGTIVRLAKGARTIVRTGDVIGWIDRDPNQGGEHLS
jgi:pyruvate/2-oxoglutarate dehydrogenase complex dihydrolipoamide acyltransferase (E2) component